MFFRANPGMTSLPCSCKEIYSQNATEELLHEDECCDLYGRSRYSNILYEKRKHPESKVTEEVEACSTIFSQLKLDSYFKTKIHEFREISPWRACRTLRDPHKACTLNSENFSTSENQRASERDQIHRRSMSEAIVNQKKNTKSENSYEATRPYSDSKLDENSRKTNYAPGLSGSRYSFGKGALDKGYKFYHFTDFWKYMKEYMNNVTIVRLQLQYQSEIFRRHGNHIAKSEKLRGNLESAPTLRACVQENSQIIDVPATKRDVASGIDAKKSNGSLSRDKSCDETCYSFKFPSFETCSFKVARCHVHGTESPRKEAHKARMLHKEQECSVINQKIQMLCQRLSNANCNTKDDGKVRRPKSTKVQSLSVMFNNFPIHVISPPSIYNTHPPFISPPVKSPLETQSTSNLNLSTNSQILQKSKTRKLEIVSRPFEKSPRKKPPVTRSKTRPSHWHDYSNLAKRFPSPRIISKSPLIGKQANFQGKIVAKKYPSKISKEYPLQLPNKTKKIFLQYGTQAVHGNI